jgi:serine/threonine protein phosphatase PrpC
LHNNIILHPEFPSNIQNAITQGCKSTEEDFIKNVAMAGTNNQPANKAGSCALIVFLVNEDVYVCNVGDSRAVTSQSQIEGHSYVSHAKEMTRDHKPSDVHEFRRII